MTIDIRDLKNRLQEILDVTAAGGEVIIYDGLTPRARLLPIPTAPPRIAGLHSGAMTVADDFNAPLPDEYWAHETPS